MDLQTDQFHILNDISAERLNLAMEGEDTTLAQALEDAGLIEHSEAFTPISLHQTSGFFEQRWMAPLVNSTCSWKDKLFATIVVVRTNWKLKRSSMADILREMAATPSAAGYPLKGGTRLAELMSALNAAFAFDRTRNQCLAYSYSLAWMARRQGIRAELVIGVRTKPFFSHAWIEYGNQAVNDDSMLREKLSVIAVA
ncbi:lasso peptide biosynthesis B2 protein [Agrobacterium sp. LAD9]|uniref:lasso peptide biosynthesis B2 protein n=1 Tax=Agrobacterium sp. LAD9 TaxID=2055153 RepID=UPI0018651D58|nr:lasso peptide biosynthesis B2 protein [Agrobacterium sp. LAD9]